ncbi:hypothetical protein M413DRAFT_277329 [Hebeloma cylindrosporum]|uniref:Uncharacterized protein n=1 Tax=Hebeloma cylindrosporum TaxID=76867 RepID=A0A0C3BKS3_HEBCY|nr:hypothetical protein M413DRAFT_277329 [Hebeloma cylindrosporum h7]
MEHKLEHHIPTLPSLLYFGPECYNIFMLMTHAMPFHGWIGMDPVSTPKFEAGEFEDEARKILASCHRS